MKNETWGIIASLIFLCVIYGSLWFMVHPIVAVIAAILTFIVYYKFFTHGGDKPKRRATPGWMKEMVLKRQGYQCGMCEKTFPEWPADFHHRTPVALGGKTEVSNLIATCPDCHSLFTRQQKARTLFLRT